ncbi:MAG: LysM peptidoglycan-binding domain-containing protein, partial [Mariprofundaceae bacterium]
MVKFISKYRLFMLPLIIGLNACASSPSHTAKTTVPIIPDQIITPEQKEKAGSRQAQSSLEDVSQASAKGYEKKSGSEWSLIVPGASPVEIVLKNKPVIRAKPPLSLSEGIRPNEMDRIKKEARRIYWKHWPVSGKRSTYYRQRILGVFADLKAPLELQVVPIVESGYNPYAISPSGAVGLWQLMPGTARHLGVPRNTSLDGSRHVEESTRAALNYLLYLKDKFKYWPLAIAAYHVGPGHMERRLRKRSWRPELGINNLPAPYITRAYVRHVVGLAALYHEGDLLFPEAINTEALTIQGPVDLTELESASGLDKTSLFLLNPGLEQSRYLVGAVTFHVPADQLMLVQANIKVAKPRTFYVTVKHGDSLWGIARQHRTSVEALRTLNPGTNNKALSIGQRLKVRSTASGKLKYATAANPLLSSRKLIRYKVRRGDSVWSIAQKFGTSTRAISKANGLGKRSLIRPGQRLLVP